jgi:hypothetical protein
MSQIDERAKAVLIPLITGQSILLNPDGQMLVATWIAMKIMVCEFERPEFVVTPQDQRTFLWLNKRIPDDWRVWIARHNDPLWTNSFHRKSVTLHIGEGGTIAPSVRPAKNTQAVVFGIGQLLIQLVSTTVAALNFDIPAEQRHILRPLWPYVSEIIWPPLVTVSPHGVAQIREAFNYYLKTIPWAPGAG